MTDTQSSVIVERHGAIAKLVFNRPDAGNTLDVAMSHALLKAAIACDEDESIRCVVLTGRGRFFCAGGDVKSFAAAGDDITSLLKEITAYGHAAVSRLMRMKKPLITAINGPAAGAGVGFAMIGDIAIASDSAHFTLAYSALGYSPDCGVSFLLPRLVGLRKAQELLLTNPRVAAEEAQCIGLVTRVAPAQAFHQQVDDLAAQLAAGPTRAFANARALLLESFEHGLEGHLDAEVRSLVKCARTDHGREGVKAFVEKRLPSFQS